MLFAGKRQLNISGRQMLRRGLSGLLSLALLLQCVVFTIPQTAEAAGAAGAQWTHKDPVIVDSMNLHMSKKLTALGNGNYQLEYWAQGTTTEYYKNTNSKGATEGYYIIFTSGDYQIDLYGGKGGSGYSQSSIGDSTGGAAGHVHGTASLTKGHVLYFTLGGNGESKNSGVTGGANGGGGSDGSTSIIGGGGGFSAVYLLDYTTYTEDQLRSLTLDELRAAAAGNHLMIAGGGGGGGSVSGLANYTANGAAGGVGTAGSGGTATTGGYYFSGTNGDSSSSAAGNGSGASGGGDNSTNPWTEASGAGGNSDGRGGAGGAGYAGGDAGGSTLGLLGVGGGGGGSSFIASSVKAPKTTVKPNTSGTGGGVAITYASAESAKLSSVAFKATISEYFDVTVVSGNVTANKDTNVVSGTLNLQENSHTVILNLAARYGTTFGGGNNVPLLAKQTSLTVGSTAVYYDNTADDVFDGNHLDDPDDTVTDYANVPLNYSVATTDYPNGTHEGKYVKDLHTKPYSTNAFVDSLTYTVYAGETAIDETAAETTALDYGNYVVVLTVTPKPTTGDGGTGLAVVGTEVGTTMFYGTALVSQSVITTQTVKSGQSSRQLTVTRDLTYSGGTYLLDVNVQAVQTEGLPPSWEAYTPAVYSASGETTHRIDIDGWYYIEAWGADGGNSADVDVNDGTDDHRTAAGKQGGNGGYISGLYYLTAGTVLNLRTSAKPATPVVPAATPEQGIDDDKQATKIAVGPGVGGDSSYVALDGTPLLAAGGGGGGGASVAVGRWYQNAVLFWRYDFKGAASDDDTELSQPATAGKNGEVDVDSQAAGTWNTGDDLDKKFNGASADTVTYDNKAQSRDAEGNFWIQNTNSMSWARGTEGGAAGANYLNTSRIATNLPSDYQERLTNVINNKLAGGDNGQVRITPIGYTLDYYKTSLANYRPEVTVNVTFSRYFTLQGITTADGQTVTYTQVSNSDNTTTYTVTMSSYAGGFVSNVIDGKTALVASGEFDLIFSLIPAEGFYGGNDVPLVTNAVVTSGTNEMPLLADDKADYANVPLLNVSNWLTPATGEIKYIAGSDPLDLTTLYSTSIPDLSQEDWKAAFVNVAGPNVFPQNTTPNVTTTYTITAGLEPKTYASKATVADPVSGNYVTVEKEVKVGYKVVTSLSGLSASGFSSPIEGGVDLNGTLTPHTGYSLPSAINVTVAGTDPLDPADYTYNSGSGQFSIPAYLITGTVTIAAQAIHNEYTLTFVVEKDGEESEWKKVEGLHYGDSIEEHITAAENQVAVFNNAADRPKYTTFQWTNLPTDTNMPAQNMVIKGVYMPDELKVIIHYVYEDGSEAADSVEATWFYAVEYTKESPAITGYTPDPEIVKFTQVDELEDDTVTKTVTYKPTPYMLTINYVDADGNELREAEKTEVRYKDPYEVTSPEIEGYKLKDATQATVSGTMGAGDLTVNVVYEPLPFKLTITYQYEDGTEAAETYTADVLYGKPYSVDSPEIEGYSPNEPVISAEKMPAAAVNKTVIYTPNEYTLTINYVDVDGNPLKDFDNGGTVSPFTKTVLFGEGYEETIPAFTGYDRVVQEGEDENDPPETVSGTMGAGDVTVNLVYQIKQYPVTIYPVDPFGKAIELSEGVTSHTTMVNHGEETTITPPVITGYTSTVAPFTQTWTGPESRTITYTIDGAVFYVTVEWGDLTFDYSKGEEWNGNTHQYHILAATTGTNYVKVTNQPLTRAPVFTTVYFDPNEAAYPNMSAEFSIEGETNRTTAVETISGYEIGAGLGKTYWLWLYGSLTTEQANTNLHTVGECVVQISATNPNQQETQGG